MFKLFDTAQNQQQVQDIACKIRDHTFVEVYKNTLFTAVKLQII